MAKDGTARGGARIGAGGKKKPLADKVLEGNPGRRKLKVIEFPDTADLKGQVMPHPRTFLSEKQKNGKELVAIEIYEKTWEWLKENRCSHLFPALLLEQYAMSVSRWVQCEECITEFGFLAKHPTTGNAIPSPYVAMFDVNGVQVEAYQKNFFELVMFLEEHRKEYAEFILTGKR